MASPFPGMDPWLESPGVWRGLHALLIGYTVEQLQPQLMPRGYYADIEERIWVAEGGVYPDVTVVRHSPTTQQAATSALVADEPVRVERFQEELREGFVQIREQGSHRLVTSIEILSPANKSRSRGRRLFRRKQRELKKGAINLVEIDLLRHGRHALVVPLPALENVQPWDYLTCVWRPNQKDYEVYPTQLRNRLPRVRTPLKVGDEDVILNLQAALNRAYEAGPYPVKLDYSRPPLVPLSDEDATWADELLREAGLRK